MKNRPDDAPGFVYLLGPLEGCVKIGQSKDPHARIQTIGTMPVELPLLASIATIRVRWLESYLHRAFADYRVRGEWFRLSPADVALLSGVLRADSPSEVPAAVAAMHDANALAQGERKRALAATPERAVTSWKVRKPVAKTLRLIGAYLDLNQEDVLELFLPVFESRLAEIQEREQSDKARVLTEV